MPDDAFDLMAATLKQFAASQQQPPAGQQQQAPLANPAFAHLFTHQANGGDQNQFNAGQKTLADLAKRTSITGDNS